MFFDACAKNVTQNAVLTEQFCQEVFQKLQISFSAISTLFDHVPCSTKSILNPQKKYTNSRLEIIDLCFVNVYKTIPGLGCKIFARC